MIKLTVDESKATLKTEGTTAANMKATEVREAKNYEKLTHKPQINGVELIGNKSGEELGLLSAEDVDTELNETSGNPIANRAVYAAGAALLGTVDDLAESVGALDSAVYDLQASKQDALTFDAEPTPGSTNPVTSEGVYNAIADAKEEIPEKTSDLMNDGADGTSTYVEADELAAVATSGSYNDLTNKPTIPAAQVNADWNATSGVAQILNKPSIPDSTSDLTNDSGYVTAAEAANAAPVQSVNGQTGAVSLGASDVGALPDNTAIPTKTSDLTNDSDYITETVTDAKLAGKADSAGASAGYAAKMTAAIPYGELDLTSTATVMTATVTGITELKSGVCVMLRNGVVTSASGFTLDVNGLGAKPVYNSMAAATRDTTIFNVAYTMMFVYDEDRVSGGCWVCYRGYDMNTNTIGYQVRTNSSTLPAQAKFYRYRILFTSADGAKWVPSNTSTSTNATAKRDVNQTKIDPFGEIVYYGTTTAIEAGANVTAAQLWQQYTLSLGYSFNRSGAALALTYQAPVYIKCAPQVDGSAIIDANEPYVQALPTSKDGFIYIFLGRAYSATNVEMTIAHPVYYHDGVGIKLWVGTDISTLASKEYVDNLVGDIEAALAALR